MAIQPSELWVADIPFTSGSASKKRPVLVLWLDGLDVVVAAVTSATPRSPTDGCLTQRLEARRAASAFDRAPVTFGLPGTIAADPPPRDNLGFRRATPEDRVVGACQTSFLSTTPVSFAAEAFHGIAAELTCWGRIVQ